MIERPLFNVAQLMKEPVGATRAGEVQADLRALVPELLASEQAQAGPQSPLSGPVRLMHTTEGVLVQGKLAAMVTLPCSRCLEPVTVPLQVSVEETFTPTIDIITGQFVRPEEEDQALWIDEHHILDLSEVLRQDVLVAVPLHVLCRPDCRGLCPTCGQNLNEGTCNCGEEPDPRWSRLVDLLKSSSEDEPSEKE